MMQDMNLNELQEKFSQYFIIQIKPPIQSLSNFYIDYRLLLYNKFIVSANLFQKGLSSLSIYGICKNTLKENFSNHTHTLIIVTVLINEKLYCPQMYHNQSCREE